MTNNNHNLQKGETYYYISIPNCCDWSSAKVLHCDYNGGNLEEYYFSTTKSVLDQLVERLKTVILQKFNQREWKPVDGTKYYWVTLNYPSHLKTIHIKGEEAPNHYPCNYFETEEEAEEMKRQIWNVLQSFS